MTIISLSQKQKRYLKQQSHHLPVIVTVGGKGVTPTVIEELSIALERHELLKVKIPAMPKADKQELAEILSEQCVANLVNIIGRTVTLYRKPENLPADKAQKYNLPKESAKDTAQ